MPSPANGRGRCLRVFYCFEVALAILNENY